MAGDDTPLEKVALLVSRALNPSLDVVGVLAHLDELAAQCSTPTRDGVMRQLFGDGSAGRFGGDVDDYHDWRNSCIDQVLARRKGMPISLAIVAIAVARRVGVELVGVGMPGHFLVGDPLDVTWFSDPFRGVTGLDREGCRDLASTLGIAPWRDSYLEPTPWRHVIVRVLNNLQASCAGRGDHVRLAIVMQLRQAIPGFAAESAAAHRALTILN